MRRLRTQSGQSAAEYAGILVLIGAIFVALFATGLPARVSGAVTTAVCQITGEGCPDDGTTPQPGDADGDGIPDAEDAQPANADADDDGVVDGRDPDPNSADADGDGLSDKEELENGLDPKSADTDGDGLDDADELAQGTDPFSKDTDGDGDEDGDDDNPATYDGNFGDIVSGVICGESGFGPCPDDDDANRGTLEFTLGHLLSGLVAVGDVRDGIDQLLNGEWGEAGLSALGIVPIAGDALKIGNKARKLISKFPERRAETFEALLKLFPEGTPFRKEALDAATDGGFSKLKDAGLSDDAIEQLLKRGNDVGKLADEARLSQRALDPAAGRAVSDDVTANWPRSRRAEGFGVETALADLRKDPNIEILVDGRPGSGLSTQGPDIIAIDKRTGRPIIVEAKGSTSGTPLSSDRLKGTADGQPQTQTSPEWLTNDRERYLNALERSTDPAHRRAADAIRDITEDAGGYDVRIYNTNVGGSAGYGRGVDDAVSGIKKNGQVGNVDIIDTSVPR